MQALAIIPARGGSKGIIRKNIRIVAGKPLLAYSIEAALKAKSIDRVVVSTDDNEIAAAAEQYGAEVVIRPSEISGDESSSESALIHVINYLREQEAYEPDLIAFLQCTSPLTLPEDIDGTIETLLNGKADSALSVAPFHYFIWEKKEDNNAVGINHDKTSRLRRQENQSQFIETGAVYIMCTEGFKKCQHRFFGKTVMYEMPKERVLEIDTPEDLLLAEALIRNLHK